MGTRSTRGTTGDYRHYPPCYPKGGAGITIDNTDPVFPVISVDGGTSGVTEVVGSSHVTVDSSDPSKPVVATSGLVNRVHGEGQIIVDNTDEDNPIVRTTGLVESVNGSSQITVDNTDEENPVISTIGLVEGVGVDSNLPFNISEPTPNNKQISARESVIEVYLSADQTVDPDDGYVPYDFDTTTASVGTDITYDFTNKRVVFNTPGIYLLTVMVNVESSDSGENLFWMYGTKYNTRTYPFLYAAYTRPTSYTSHVYSKPVVATGAGSFFQPTIRAFTSNLTVRGGYAYHSKLVVVKIL